MSCPLDYLLHVERLLQSSSPESLSRAIACFGHLFPRVSARMAGETEAYFYMSPGSNPLPLGLAAAVKDDHSTVDDRYLMDGFQLVCQANMGRCFVEVGDESYDLTSEMTLSTDEAAGSWRLIYGDVAFQVTRWGMTRCS